MRKGEDGFNGQGRDVIEIVNQSTASHSTDASLVHQVAQTSGVPVDQSLAAIAYAAFFTEAERDEIGTFEELPATERARWQSVAAHIARTVVSPVDEDIEAWRAEQRAELAEQVREAPYSREVWRAMTRTTDMQQQIAALRDLLLASKACIAIARSHSQRLATSAQSLEHPIWSADPAADRPDDRTRPEQRPGVNHPGGAAWQHDRVIRRI